MKMFVLKLSLKNQQNAFYVIYDGRVHANVTDLCDAIFHAIFTILHAVHFCHARLFRNCRAY